MRKGRSAARISVTGNNSQDQFAIHSRYCRGKLIVPRRNLSGTAGETTVLLTCENPLCLQAELRSLTGQITSFVAFLSAHRCRKCGGSQCVAEIVPEVDTMAILQAGALATLYLRNPNRCIAP